MNDQILRYKAVSDTTGLSRTTLWRLERDGRFPHRRQISTNAVGWLRSEVDEWIAARRPASTSGKQSC